MQSFILTAITATENCALILDSVKCRSGSWCMLKQCVKGNYCARLYTHSYRELHFNSRLYINFDKVNGA